AHGDGFADQTLVAHAPLLSSAAGLTTPLMSPSRYLITASTISPKFRPGPRRWRACPAPSRRGVATDIAQTENAQRHSAKHARCRRHPIPLADTSIVVGDLARQ